MRPTLKTYHVLGEQDISKEMHTYFFIPGRPKKGSLVAPLHANAQNILGYLVHSIDRVLRRLGYLL